LFIQQFEGGTSMSVEFTGERFLPEISGQIAFEHLHRYYFAQRLIKGRRVLDVACGEGYGSWILSSLASEVVGVDIDPGTVARAREKYVGPNIEFVEASAAKLPFDDGAFDAVVSFETIEHHDLHQEMMSEIKRVLRKDGVLIISSPNKQHYSIEPGYSNPFHVKELFREEFLDLTKSYFANVILFSQRVVHGSLMVMEDDHRVDNFESMALNQAEFSLANGLSKPLYDLLIATNDGVLPEVSSTLFEATVHGLEPARFYGVHLPSRVAKADAKVAELQKLADERGASVEDGLRAIKEKEASAAALQLQLEQLQASFAQAQANYAQAQVNFEQAQTQTRADYAAQVAMLGDRLGASEKTLARMQSSWSWRLTSPLRWANAVLLRAGRNR
jgi:ubiquinone/menaquinone biosynthesis C-methylase UbiE